MRRDLMISNAFAIALWASKNVTCKHLTVSVSKHYANLTIYFDLNSPIAIQVKHQIMSSSNFTPEFNRTRFDEDGFETLSIEWNLPDED